MGGTQEVLAVAMKITASKLRLVGLIGLLVLAGLIAIPRWLSVTSAEGVLNGRAIVVRAPLDGRLDGRLPAIGDPVVSGDRIAVIEPLPQPGERREALRVVAEIAELDGRIDALLLGLGTLEDLSEEAAARSELHASRSAERAEQRLLAATAEMEAARASLAFAKEREAALKKLAAAGAVASLEASEARSAAGVAEARVSAAAADLEQARIEAQAAHLSVNLMDGQNDVPYSRQRLDDLRLRRVLAETEVSGLTARRDALQSIVDQTSRGRILTAPVDAVVWRRLVASGSDVTRGEEIMVLVDCSDVFVQARIAETEVADIAVGDPVVVEIAGRPGSLLGTVATSRGTADEMRRDDGVAGLQPVGDGRWVQLEIALDPQDLRIGDSSFCDVGAGARISFPRKIDRSWF